MKKLPEGNYALCIAHPGHELRLHGLLEISKPFVFILTDGSKRTGYDMMMDSIKSISRAIRHGIKTIPGDNSWNRVFIYIFPKNPENEKHLKDVQIYSEIVNQRTGFFVSYIDFIAKNLIKNNIDYLISDSSEGENVCHEAMRMMADIAIKIVKKKTGKQIPIYDFAIYNPFNNGLNDECIHLNLDHEQVDRKLEAILKYPFALTDLRPNISVDINLIMEFEKMKDGKEQVKALLKEINSDFLHNEYIRPSIFSESSEKPNYELKGEKAVADGKYKEVITYNNHLKPLKEKLSELILNPISVKIGS